MSPAGTASGLTRARGAETHVQFNVAQDDRVRAAGQPDPHLVAPMPQHVGLDLELDDGLQEIRGEPAVGYYPKSVQMADGEVFIVGHVGGDDGYGCVDQSIVAVRFFLGG